MKNEDQWKPTKYQLRNGQLVVTRDRKELAIASRLSASRVLTCYNRHLGDHCRGDLLDLGCGKAPFYAAYRPLVDSIYCVDWDNCLHGTTHVDQHADLTQALPLPDAAYDSILLSSVLEHIPTPWTLCEEIHRILRPSGKLLMNVPFLYWLHETPHDFYRYTEYALERMLGEAGLKIVVLESTGGAPVVLTDVFCKSVVKMPGASLFNAVAQSAMSGLLSTRLGKRLNKRSERLMPNGYFVVAQKPACSQR